MPCCVTMAVPSSLFMNSGEVYRYGVICFRILLNNGIAISIRSWNRDINCHWGLYNCNRRCIEGYLDWEDKPLLRYSAGATAFPALDSLPNPASAQRVAR